MRIRPISVMCFRDGQPLAITYPPIAYKDFRVSSVHRIHSLSHVKVL